MMRLCISIGFSDDRRFSLGKVRICVNTKRRQVEAEKGRSLGVAVSFFPLYVVLALCCVCMRVSNILCDGESSLYKRRYRPGIVCMFFRSHITHHTPPRRICAHRAHTSSAAPPPLRIIQKYFYFYCNCTYTNTLYVHNNYCIPIYCARPPPAPPRRGR